MNPPHQNIYKKVRLKACIGWDHFEIFAVRLLSIESVTQWICSNLRFLFTVGSHVLAYQLAAIAIDRLIVLILLKRHKKLDFHALFYCYYFYFRIKNFNASNSK